MREDVYKIEGPAIVSFSGGSTSGFMLWKILQAHGGRLPVDVVPVFANTGLEHEKTYEFIRDCERFWKTKIRWVEFAGKRNWREVDFETASRNGEPFELLIKERNYLPNPITRFCTGVLKIQTISAFAGYLFNGKDFLEAIGLRYDEPRRISSFKKWTGERDICFPLFADKKTTDDVFAFWNQNHFKLGIQRVFSNCVGCFLKGAGNLAFIEEQEPGALEWWSRQEERGVNGKPAKFRSDRPSYRGLIQMVKDQKTFQFPEDDALPCSCTD